jgi:DNA-binding NtrC family response regulator
VIAAILCVDDEALLLFCLKQELLRRFGDRFQYETALSAKDAIERIEELREEGVTIALIITDWIMPGMKGDDFLIAVEHKYPGISSVVLSGQTDEDSVRRISEHCRVLACVEKPYRAARIFELVEEASRRTESPNGGCPG